MVIEEALVNYGILGIWTLSLLIERYKGQNNIQKIIQNNTLALTNFKNVIQKCKKHKI